MPPSTLPPKPKKKPETKKENDQVKHITLRQGLQLAISGQNYDFFLIKNPPGNRTGHWSI